MTNFLSTKQTEPNFRAFNNNCMQQTQEEVLDLQVSLFKEDQEWQEDSHSTEKILRRKSVASDTQYSFMELETGLLTTCVQKPWIPNNNMSIIK